MKRRFITALLLFGCVLAAVAAIADMSGKWASVFNAPDGSQYPLSYTFKIDGDKLTGTLDVAGMTVPIDSGVVKGDNLSFSIDAQGTAYSHKGKYFAAGDSISMDVVANGTKSHETLKRP